MHIKTVRSFRKQEDRKNSTTVKLTKADRSSNLPEKSLILSDLNFYRKHSLPHQSVNTKLDFPHCCLPLDQKYSSCLVDGERWLQCVATTKACVVKLAYAVTSLSSCASSRAILPTLSSGSTFGLTAQTCTHRVLIIFFSHSCNTGREELLLCRSTAIINILRDVRT
jgi:hypothetical protein